MTPREQKTDDILDASLAVFCRYGFRKTSMQDIAQEVGMSRAALYLHFKSKEDVFRVGSQRKHGLVMQQVEAILNGSGNVFERLAGALTGFTNGLMADISSSAHAPELFSANLELSGEVTCQAKNTLISLLQKTLTEAHAAQEIDLAGAGVQAIDVARLAVATMDGVKHMPNAANASSEGVGVFIQVLIAALRPRKRVPADGER